jgi:iron complex transport system ATP-binding protein
VPDSTDLPTDPVVDLHHVSFERDGRAILHEVDWRISPGERWLVLGANGSGKTTLLRIVSLYEHPTRGDVHVLGEMLGRVDVRRLRRRIAIASPALADRLRPQLTATEVVMTAHFAALEPWWHTYGPELVDRAISLLDRLHVGHFADRPVSTLSSGELQRVLLARALMNDPGILLLDEPTARLDLGGREELVASLDDLARTMPEVPMVLVSHHLEETPPSTTHVLALRRGEVLASGPIDTTLDDALVSACFGLDLRIERSDDGRLSARSTNRRRRPD